MPLNKAVSEPILGCKYSEAISEPPFNKDFGLFGKANLTKPASLAGLISPLARLYHGSL